MMIDDDGCDDDICYILHKS